MFIKLNGKEIININAIIVINKFDDNTVEQFKELNKDYVAVVELHGNQSVYVNQHNLDRLMEYLYQTDNFVVGCK